MTNYVEFKWEGMMHSHPDIANRIIGLISTELESGQIAELGCGSGWVCHRLAEKGYAVTGVDLSESGIASAKANGSADADFILESIDSGLAGRIEREGQYDLVLSNDVIEHLYRPGDLLEAAKGLLKPKGKLIIATPYHGYAKNLAIALLGKVDAHYDPLWDGGHIKFFSEKSLKTLLAAHGFKINRFEHVGRFFGMWKSMICIASVQP